MRSLEKAIKLYSDFHSFEPKELGEFPGGGLHVPQDCVCVGDAITIFYTSNKIEPYTLVAPGKKGFKYYHEHKKGVKVFVFDRRKNGTFKHTSKKLLGAKALTKLGRCDGFLYSDIYGEEIEAVCQGNTDLYATPDGKALLVVENKRKLLAALWGGKLNVEPRGIVN